MDFLSNLIKRPISLVLNDSVVETNNKLSTAITTTTTSSSLPLPASIPLIEREAAADINHILRQSLTSLDNHNNHNNHNNRGNHLKSANVTVNGVIASNLNTSLSMNSVYQSGGLTDFIGIPDNKLDEFKEIISSVNSELKPITMRTSTPSPSPSPLPSLPPSPASSHSLSTSPLHCVSVKGKGGGSGDVIMESPVFALNAANSIGQLLIEINDNLQQVALNDANDGGNGDAKQLPSITTPVQHSPLTACKNASINSKISALSMPTSTGSISPQYSVTTAPTTPTTTSTTTPTPVDTKSQATADVVDVNLISKSDCNLLTLSTEELVRFMDTKAIPSINTVIGHQLTQKFKDLSEFDETKIPELPDDLHPIKSPVPNEVSLPIDLKNGKLLEDTTTANQILAGNFEIAADIRNKNQEDSSLFESYTGITEEIGGDTTVEMDSYCSAVSHTFNETENTLDNIDGGELHHSYDEIEPMDVDMDTTKEISNESHSSLLDSNKLTPKTPQSEQQAVNGHLKLDGNILTTDTTTILTNENINQTISNDITTEVGFKNKNPHNLNKTAPLPSNMENIFVPDGHKGITRYSTGNAQTAIYREQLSKQLTTENLKILSNGEEKSVSIPLQQIDVSSNNLMDSIKAVHQAIPGEPVVVNKELKEYAMQAISSESNGKESALSSMQKDQYGTVELSDTASAASHENPIKKIESDQLLNTHKNLAISCGVNSIQSNDQNSEQYASAKDKRRTFSIQSNEQEQQEPTVGGNSIAEICHQSNTVLNVENAKENAAVASDTTSEQKPSNCMSEIPIPNANKNGISVKDRSSDRRRTFNIEKTDLKQDIAGTSSNRLPTGEMVSIEAGSTSTNTEKMDISCGDEMVVALSHSINSSLSSKSVKTPSAERTPPPQPSTPVNTNAEEPEISNLVHIKLESVTPEKSSPEISRPIFNIQKRPPIRGYSSSRETPSPNEQSTTILIKKEKNLQADVENNNSSLCNELFVEVSSTSTDSSNCNQFLPTDEQYLETTATGNLSSNSQSNLSDRKQFNDNEFNSGNNLILNPSDFDYLLSKGNNNGPVDRNSLLLKFDPLLGVPVLVNQNPDTATHNNNINLNSSLSPMLEEDEQNGNSLSYVITETTNTTQPDLQQQQQQSGGKILQETLPVTVQQQQQPQQQQQQQQLLREQSPQFILKAVNLNANMSADVIKDMSLDNDCNNKTFNKSNSSQTDENSQINYKMDEIEKKIKNEVLKTEDIEKKLKDAEQREEALIKRISDKDKMISKMTGVIEAYEKAIAELIAEKAQLIQNYEKELTEVRADRDSNYHHLTSLETTFSDLHVKYEKSKEMTSQLKASEEKLLAEKRKNLENLRQQEQRYERMKNHAIQQLETANKQLDTLAREHTMETTKLKALLKKEEIARSSINEQLIQKTKENAELVKICDELIAGQSS